MTAAVMFFVLFPALMLAVFGSVVLTLGLAVVPIIGGYAYARSGRATVEKRSLLWPGIAVASICLFVTLALFSLVIAFFVLFGADVIEPDDSRLAAFLEIVFAPYFIGLFALQIVVTGLLGGVGGLIDFTLRKGEQSRVDSVPKPAGLERYDPWK